MAIRSRRHWRKWRLPPQSCRRDATPARGGGILFGGRKPEVGELCPCALRTASCASFWRDPARSKVCREQKNLVTSGVETFRLKLRCRSSTTIDTNLEVHHGALRLGGLFTTADSQSIRCIKPPAHRLPVTAHQVEQFTPAPNISILTDAWDGLLNSYPFSSHLRQLGQPDQWPDLPENWQFANSGQQSSECDQWRNPEQLHL